MDVTAATSPQVTITERVALIAFTDGATPTPAAIAALALTELATEPATSSTTYTVALANDPGAAVAVAISAAGSDLRFSATEDGASATRSR